MAAPRKFHIPTAEEIELSEKEDALRKPESLFKKAAALSVDPSNKDLISVSKGNVSYQPKIRPLTNKSPDTVVQKLSESNKKQEDPTNQQESTNEKGLESNTDNASLGQESVPSKTSSSNSLIVNTRQRGNPILKSVRNIPWEYGNIVADYVMGQSHCALFLSLRYHQLHPNYIHDRLKQLGRSYDLRVMLVQVDVKDPHHLLKDLAKMCILADCTLILAFSAEEAGRYLETYKIFENKPPEAIMEKTEENFMAKFTDCLTRVKSVNKTDCATLLSHFGSLSSVIEASKEDLSLCPGFGPQKANRLYEVFHEPFVRANARKRRLSGPSSNKAR